MLRDVRERFGDEEVDGGLDMCRQTLGGIDTSTGIGARSARVRIAEPRP